jgi:NAD+--asparagine ADP-ribosyltransferase
MEIDEKKFETFQTDLLKSIAEVKSDFQTAITEVKADFKQAIKDEGRSTRDFVRQEINASEHRMKEYVDEKTDVVLVALSHTLDTDIQPQIDKHDQRLTKLEAKTA